MNDFLAAIVVAIIAAIFTIIFQDLYQWLKSWINAPKSSTSVIEDKESPSEVQD